MVDIYDDRAYFKDADSIEGKLQATQLPGVDPDFDTGAFPDNPIYAALLGPSGAAYIPAFEEFLRDRSSLTPNLWTKDRTASLRGGVDDFVGDWIAFLKDFLNEIPVLNEIHARTPFPVPPPAVGSHPPLGAADETAIRDGAKAAFTTEFEAVLRMNSGAPDDWTGLTADTDPARVSDLLNKSFKAWSGMYADTAAFDPTTLFQSWAGFLSATATLRTATAQALQTTGLGPLISFETVLRAYTAGSSDEVTMDTQVIARLQEFIDRYVKSPNDQFLPSQMIDEFTRDLQRTFSKEQRLDLTPAEVERRNVMLIIFQILRVILERLQETVSVQSRRLFYLGTLQSNYTQLINRVPIYRESPPELIGNINNGSHVELSPFIPEFPLFGTNNFVKDEEGVLGRELGQRADGSYYYSSVDDIPSDMQRRIIGTTRQGGAQYYNGQDGMGGDLELQPGTRDEIIEGLKPNDTPAAPTAGASNANMDATVGTKSVGNLSDEWLDRKGFAGISLREVFDYFTEKGETEKLKVFVEDLRTPSGNLVDLNPFQPGIQSGNDVNGDHIKQHPYQNMRGVVYPGVYWFIEQPYDGSKKWTPNQLDQKPEDAKADQADKRNTSINPIRNQWIEQLRGFRGIAKDEAKQAQTNLTSTREGVNQQANLMSSIIQQLQGILQGIFK